MKKLLSIFSLTIGLLMCTTTFVACSSDDDNNNESSSNPLVGTWRAEVEEKGELQYWEMTYNADFTYSFKEYNKSNNYVHNQGNGRYELIDNNTVKMMPTGEEAYTGRFIITDGNKLEFLNYDHGIIWIKIGSSSNNVDKKSVKKRTIHVERAGTLADYISEEEKYSIEELTITGKINGVDFRILREMAGKKWKENNIHRDFSLSRPDDFGDTDGKLSYLDISGATIVAGGYHMIYTGEYEEIKFPHEVDNTIPHYLFCGCKKLKTIKISNDVHCIGTEAFEGTAWYENQPDGLVYLGKVLYSYKGKMPSNTTIKIKKGTIGIASYAFKDCEGLVSVSIPDGIKSIGILNDMTDKYISAYCRGVFESCKNLESVSIPSSVTMICSYLFLNCKNLQIVNVMIESPKPLYLPFDTSFYSHDNNNTTLIVPKGTKSTYKSTKGWSDFYKIVEDTE